MNKKVALRLLQEFWLPGVVAVGWTAYNVYTSSGGWGLKAVVNIFGPSFFLTSWATGQFFRVRKQVALDQNLTAIESRVDAVLQRLEKHAQDFLGYTTGADSFVSFLPMFTAPEQLELGLLNNSTYPVFDVQAEVIDLDEPIDPDKGKFWTRLRFNLPSLFPSRIVMSAYRFDMRGRERLYLNIFIQTRSQGSMQQLRVARVDGAMKIATRTRVGEKVVEQTVPDGFPGWNAEKPDDLFN
ncbi:MAG: hypothetical protein M0Z70_03475 [Nitrospiraceae bacterium]|nr:hypothetical protein [Nitrospiraceae bacterium]